MVRNEIWDDAFIQGLKSLKLEYGTSNGNFKLRQMIGEKLNVDAEQLVITNEAVFGNFLSILSSCETGDVVITVAPNFPPTMDIIINEIDFEKFGAIPVSALAVGDPVLQIQMR